MSRSQASESSNHSSSDRSIVEVVVYLKRSCPCRWTERHTAGNPGCGQSCASEPGEAGCSSDGAVERQCLSHSLQ